MGFGVDSEIDVVPNGVDLQPFASPIEPIERSELGYGPDEVLLIYVGRLGPEKNLPFLLRAVAGTAQAYPNVRLVIVGGGPEEDNLKDRVQLMGLQDQVNFVGRIDYKVVPRYLTMADAFVSASVTEVHPLSIIEAMAAGLPVLGTNSPGVGDTVQDWETGFLVDQDDLSGFTAKMVRMVVDAEERRAMGVRAQEASKDYSIERTTQMMLDRYRRVIKQSADRKRGMRARILRWIDNFR
jgi:glycosyltransferase involved in cell wall biosynthesis